MTWEQIVACVALAISIMVFLKDYAWSSMKKFLCYIKVFFSRNWYWILIIASTTYVIFNWSDCIDFEFFGDFQGDNLVFVLWAILLLLPLFDKLEIMGVNVRFNIQNKESEKAMNDAINGQVTSLAELESIKKDKEGQNV